MNLCSIKNRNFLRPANIFRRADLGDSENLDVLCKSGNTSHNPLILFKSTGYLTPRWTHIFFQIFNNNESIVMILSINSLLFIWNRKASRDVFEMVTTCVQTTLSLIIHNSEFWWKYTRYHLFNYSTFYKIFRWVGNYTNT